MFYYSLDTPDYMLDPPAEKPYREEDYEQDDEEQDEPAYVPAWEMDY